MNSVHSWYSMSFKVGLVGSLTLVFTPIVCATIVLLIGPFSTSTNPAAFFLALFPQLWIVPLVFVLFVGEILLAISYILSLIGMFRDKRSTLLDFLLVTLAAILAIVAIPILVIVPSNISIPVTWENSLIGEALIVVSQVVYLKVQRFLLLDSFG